MEEELISVNKETLEAILSSIVDIKEYLQDPLTIKIGADTYYAFDAFEIDDMKYCARYSKSLIEDMLKDKTDEEYN